MRPFSEVLLLLSLLGLARATTTMGLDGSIPPDLGIITYEDVVSATVELLNSRPVSPYILRLREVQPWPSWPTALQQRHELSFTVEETSCRAPLLATSPCKRRWFGTVSRCQGWVFLEQQHPTVELSCEKEKLPRIRTSKFKEFLLSLKDRFRSFFGCSRIWIRDRLNLKPTQS